ncbi:response regulator receiver domain [Micromonospora sp. NPDC049275]|uniref:response regulator receiver domain n=1 Tax=Micromonospora sp. NPDC049275 TaxID=3364268 RepID=UPI00371932ED
MTATVNGVELLSSPGTRFLRNVILVDDRALAGGSGDQSSSDSALVNVAVPDEVVAQFDGGDKEPSSDDGVPDPIPSRVAPRSPLDDLLGDTLGPSGDIDTAALVDAFADIGIACAIMAPETAEGDDRRRILQLANRSDIVILDWILASRDGSHRVSSDSLIREIVEQDKLVGGRLRLLCVYTTDPDLGAVQRTILRSLESVYKDEDVEATDSDGRLLICGPHLRVVIYAKPVRRVRDNIVTEAELPARLVSDFNEFSRGLLSGLVLHSLGVVKDEAHRLLARFPDELDAPYLSHRAMVGPVQAEQFALQLVSDELGSVLSSANVQAAVHQAQVERRLEYLLPRQRSPRAKLGNKYVSLDRDSTFQLLSEVPDDKTVSLTDGEARSMKKFRNYTSLLVESEERANELDHSFAALSCLARNPKFELESAPPPVLALGTLVQRVFDPRTDSDQPPVGDRYFLCLQPLCDTVRLSGPTPFPFIPLLGRTEGDTKPFNIVTFAPQIGGGSAERCYLSTTGKRIRDLKMMEFTPNTERFVGAVWDAAGGAWLFRDTRGDAYWWLGDLRTDHGHRMAGNFGSMLGRIGLDESEWLRLMAE